MAIYGNLVGYMSGGSGGLNFSVVSYASEDSLPSTASENTIAVITDTTITSWIIAAEEPSEPSEGMVWIKIGLTSDVTFNALTDNGIILCLSKAYQYIGGAFSPVEASLYDGSSWLSFSSTAVYLYLEGDTCESLTGGYTTAAMKAASSTSGTGAPAVTYGDSSMVITPAKSTALGNYKGGIVRTVSKIDCSQYDTLIFEGTVEGIGTGNGKIAIWSEMGTVQTDNLEQYVMLANGSDPVSLDVSDLDGSYYIGFGFDSQNTQMTVTMTSLRLE